MSPALLNQCPVCGAREIRHAFTTTDLELHVNDHSYDLWRCGACESYFQNPLPAAEDIPGFYARTGYGAYAEVSAIDLRPVDAIASTARSGGAALLMSAFRGQDNRLVDAVRIIGPGRARSLLDVGCGSGQFTVELAHALGIDPAGVLGIDISDRAEAFGRRHGMRFANSRLDALPDEPRFDVISMSHVLEHELDPRALLEAAHRRLAPAGHLVLSVPNARSLPARAFGRRWIGHSVPRHLYNFSKKGVLTLASGLFDLETYSASGIFTFMLGRYYHPWLEALASRLRLSLAVLRTLLYVTELGDNQSFVFRRREPQ